MKRWSAIFLLAWAVGCDRAAPAEDEHTEAGHGEAGEHAEEEAPHLAAPPRIHLDDEVIAAANITTTEARPRVLAPTVRLPGEIVAAPDHRARVAAQIDGIVESVAVEPGDRVTADQVVAVIRAPGLDELRANEAALGAQASAAEANAERIAGLVERRMASRQEQLAAQAEAQALRARSKAARERMRALGVSRGKGDAARFSLRTPLAGVVVERPVVAGDPVVANTVVADVVATDEVWFVGHLFERDVARVRTGSAAAVYLDAYPGDTFEGTVEYVAHRVDTGARTLSARIPLHNPDDRLRLGVFGTAHVLARDLEVDATDAAVLAIPASAVTWLHGDPIAFVRDAEGAFAPRRLVLGERDPAWIQVVAGVREGEQVVSTGAFNVKGAMLRGTFGEDGH